MAWGRVRAWTGAITLAILVAGCAGPPPTAIAEFGTAAKKTTDLLGEARATGFALSDALAAENAALDYADGGSALLPPPSKPGQCISDRKRWDEAVFDPRFVALKAIADYADALSKAADPGAVEKIKSAAAGLNLALPGGGTVVSEVVGAGVSFAVTAEIRGVMRRTHPVIVEIAAQLEEDLPTLAELYQSCFRTWLSRRIVGLNGASRNAAGYAFYLESVRETAALRARVEALGKAPTILKEFVEAHAKLMESDQDIAKIVAEFDRLAVVVKALQ